MIKLLSYDFQILSLLVACLCHDLDHRGTNNTYQSKVMSPLAVLYSTSTMEHHHLDQCIMLLSDDSINILQVNYNSLFLALITLFLYCPLLLYQCLSPEQYKTAMGLIEHAILSTDLAIYFTKKNRFISMVLIFTIRKD